MPGSGSDEAAAPPLNEERARDILANIFSTSLGTHLSLNLDKRCSCNSCCICAATFLVKLQDRLTGPTIFVTGWKLGLNKIGVAKLLHEHGIGIGDAHVLVNRILNGWHRNPEDETRFDEGGTVIRIQVAEGIGRDELIAKMRDLNVLIE